MQMNLCVVVGDTLNGGNSKDMSCITFSVGGLNITVQAFLFYEVILVILVCYAHLLEHPSIHPQPACPGQGCRGFGSHTRQHRAGV